ncbi:MAG TPA: class I SAM-dependent methyltransferase [Thermoanaerobaculia bacterium]
MTTLHRQPDDLRAIYRGAIVGTTPFAQQRLDEGLELAQHFAAKTGDRRLRIIDVGAGNGGVALGLANAQHQVVAIDLVLNGELAELRTRSGIPLTQMLATADRLPFADASFDVVLCLETIEHLPNARASAREMMRVLRPGGQVMLTTPARVRHLFKPDPHYGVRGLLMLPDPLQKKVMGPSYDVEHIFWTAGGITRLFPNRGRVETLVAIPWPGRPRNVRELLWKLFRRLLWDRIVIYKR